MPWIISSCSSLLIVAVRIRLAAVGQWKQSHTELKFEFKSKFSFKSKSKSVPESHFRAAEEAKRPTRQTQVPNRVYLRYKISAVQWRPSRWKGGVGGRLPHKSPQHWRPCNTLAVQPKWVELFGARIARLWLPCDGAQNPAYEYMNTNANTLGN